jgi:hypothetical protein
MKTLNQAPFPTNLREGSPRKEPQGAHVCIPHQNHKGEATNSPKGNHQEKALKITNNGKRERNHAKPSIHAMKDSYKV